MKRLLAVLMCLILISLPAMAEGAGVLVVDDDDGSMIITENGEVIVPSGVYDVIMCVTYDECAPENRLYAAANFTVAVGSFDDAGDGDLDAWPEEEGELGGEISIEGEEDWQIDETADEPIAEDEFDDGDFTDEEYYDDYFDVMYALMNSKGELLTDFAYVDFTHDPAAGVVYATRADYFTSVLDEAGNVLLEGDYSEIVSDGNGGYFAAKPDLEAIDEYGNFPEISALYRVLSDGTETDTGIKTNTYDILPGFSSGYMCIYAYDEGSDVTGSYIYIDASGVPAFTGRYTFATNFMGNYAVVEDESYLARIIDKTGAYATNADYSYFDYGFEDDGMPIVANYNVGGFDLLSKADLSVMAHFDSPEGSEQMYAYQSGDRFIAAYFDMGMMIIDENANVVYEGNAEDSVYTWYNECDARPERVVLCTGVWPEARYMLIDSDGTTHSGEYQEISALSWIGGEGRYLVSSFDVVENEYEGEKYTEADYDTYLYGVIDQDGNTILETKYQNLIYLTGDRYWVNDDVGYYLVDANGNTIASFPMTDAE